MAPLSTRSTAPDAASSSITRPSASAAAARGPLPMSMSRVLTCDRLLLSITFPKRHHMHLRQVLHAAPEHGRLAMQQDTLGGFNPYPYHKPYQPTPAHPLSFTVICRPSC